MASFMNSVCGLCTEAITHSYEAKKLHSSRNAHALSILKNLLAELSHAAALEQLFPGDVYLCRTCLRRLEKFQSTKQDLKAIHEKLDECLKALIEAKGISESGKLKYADLFQR